MVEEGCDAEKGCDLFSLDSVDKLLCEVRYSYLEIGNGSTCPPRYFIPSDELCFFPRLFLSRGVFFEKKEKGKREKGIQIYSIERYGRDAAGTWGQRANEWPSDRSR